MTKAKRNLICLLFIMTMALVPTLCCLAQSSITTQMGSALTGSSLPTIKGDDTKVLNIIGSVIGVFLSFLGVIFLVLIIYGGYKWLMAMGREEEIDKAKDIIKSAIVGLIIVLAAYGISYFVTTSLEKTIK